MVSENPDQHGERSNAPGELYGQVDGSHVRVAFTATDERIQAAVDRLTP